ncbi:hypothetical protein ACFW04_007714 [Cataglyphis niger]
MACKQILRSDLQDLLDKYREIRDKYTALHIFSEMQQRSLECEREKLQQIKNKFKNMLRWLMKREERYKTSLDRLEKENEQLHCVLAATQRERERDELLNNDKVSKLQDEIDFLRVQLVQFEDKHKQQLISQDKHYEDEILKYKRLLDSANAKLLLNQNISSKKVQGTKKRSWNIEHPALINDENMERKINQKVKWPALEIVKLRKKRKLFQKDDETVIDII